MPLTASTQDLLAFLRKNPLREDSLDLGQIVSGGILGWSVTHRDLMAEPDGVFSVEPSSVLYLLKGRAALHLGDPSAREGEDRMELVGVGEPIVVGEDGAVLVQHRVHPCAFLVCTKTGLEGSAKALPSGVSHRLRRASDLLDDYYYGYDARYRTVYQEGAILWESASSNESLRRILDRYPEILSVQVIDLGCGEGRDSLYLGGLGVDVVGMDVSRSALDKGRARALEMGVEGRVQFLEGDIVYLRNVKDEAYGCALNMGCLHMLTSPSQRARHLARVFEILKPGGYFLIDHCQRDWGRGFYSIPDFDKIADNFIPGRSVPRRIRTEEGEKEILLTVLPYQEKEEADLIAEVTVHGFDLVESLSSMTEAFGHSAILLFQKKNPSI